MGTATRTTTRTTTSRLRAASGVPALRGADEPRTGSAGSDGPIVDATLEGIQDATKTVTDLIHRLRQVNESLLGSADIGRNDDATDAPEPSGRAYLANVRLGSLRNALVELAGEVQRLERL